MAYRRSQYLNKALKLLADFRAPSRGTVRWHNVLHKPLHKAVPGDLQGDVRGAGGPPGWTGPTRQTAPPTSEASMSKSIPHLELRRTGFFWRRRVPTAILPRYQTSFFCFPLKTHVLREAAAVASRITAISDICFRAEIDVSPEVMTRVLVTYARLEIETADRLRAFMGPQTREAAEASLALETAIRASLRDALFLCERDPALRAIESTARHLGIDLVGEDEDLPILADKMLRLMIELSEERERRTRGHFSDNQPYLALELSGENTSTSFTKTSSTAPHAPAGLERNAPAEPTQAAEQTAASDPGRSAERPSNEPDEAAPALVQATEPSDGFDA